eukprot:CAMPEP_0170544370 /NCGR_PEP_ID=MMETSP0211-20121228/3159_1 /TAXON_ID=311385 /ORGANISM="Pseudokeronopsis sp., Strain OXSARD2" /LENGTH=140 /DNA_ID=CAMNT_0010848003 /DNA_START=70 /DNA_END=492 /DNA_ORIENTATION=-
MISRLDVGYTPGGATVLTLHHVESGAGIFLQGSLIVLAVSTFHIVLKVLVVELFNDSGLDDSLDDEVVLRAQAGLIPQLTGDVAHHMLMLSVQQGYQLIKVDEICLGGPESADIWVGFHGVLGALQELLVLLNEHLTDSL